MTVDELAGRFPEIPGDLHGEDSLLKFAVAFESLLRVAVKPSACAENHTHENQYYLKLIGPMDIYRYGLYTRDRVLDEIQKLLDGHRDDPDDFVTSLLSD
ncbi:MAG: hypothetical protein QGG64_24090 [Candidatus Latescibacteria bacterium]|jgi:hypothetical protein|nr:hypothetical protein [Candidatus Latescibacterota bacterium]